MLAADELAGHEGYGAIIRHYDRRPLLGLDVVGVLTGTTAYNQEE
jgi:hypothetical protein